MSTLEEFRKSFDWSPFAEYAVRIRLHDIVGGAPKDPALVEGWVNATCKSKSDADRAAIVDATVAELGDVTDEVADKCAIGFKSDDKGLYIEGRQVKALLKEAANICRTILPCKVKGKLTKGLTAARSKVADQVFVAEERIHLGRTEPDDIEEKAIHVQTAQGPRNALKRIEIVRDVELGFTVRLREGSEITESTLCAILDYGQQLGLGADRSQGRGQYDLLSIERK